MWKTVNIVSLLCVLSIGGALGCLPTCKTPISVSICLLGLEIGEFPCPALLPVCYQGVCVATLPTTTTTTEIPDETENSEGTTTTKMPATFYCTGNGFFPHPDDCKKYYYCVDVGLIFASVQRSCPDEYVYNANTRKCDIEAQCVTMQCSNTRQYIAYSEHSRYYAYCDDNQQITVRACASGKEFDVSSSQCKNTSS